MLLEKFSKANVDGGLSVAVKTFVIWQESVRLSAIRYQGQFEIKFQYFEFHLSCSNQGSHFVTHAGIGLQGVCGLCAIHQDSVT